MNWNPRVIKINSLEEAKAELAKIGSDEQGIKLMAGKALFYAVKADNITGKAASIIKQEMLSKGGEAAVARAALIKPDDRASIMMLGTLKQYQRVAAKLKMQQFGLPRLAEQILTVIQNKEGFPPCQLKCGQFSLPLGRRTLVMGILNVTPDSFSDGGKFQNPEVAVQHAQSMIDAGADIIDIGGESTRPGYQQISVDEELSRVLPVLEMLAANISVPISIDTYKAEVAKQAVQSGATMVNDIWGLRADPQMASVVAGLGVPYIMMHNQHGTEYQDLMGDIIGFFREGMTIAQEAGLKEENIILDPGIGFGKTYEQNLEAMRRLDELTCLGRPILLGTSRKSLIKNTLQLPADDRLEGTAATVTVGIVKGVDIVRVHDVQAMVRVAKMTDAMVRTGRED